MEKNYKKTKFPAQMLLQIHRLILNLTRNPFCSVGDETFEQILRVHYGK